MGFKIVYRLISLDLKELIGKTTDLYRRQGSIDRVINLLDNEIESEAEKSNLEITNGEIILSNVTFSYDRKMKIMNGVDFKIEPKKCTCIVGFSGVGKSTIASIIIGFYDVQDGKILIDGQNIKDCKYSSLRRQVGVVQQESVIFDGTIRFNLQLGKPNCSDQEIWEACKQAYIADFIMSLPNGLDTKLGKDGVKLSGGQLQRLSIARIFLKNPKIIILDEATSSLDEEAEKAVHDALKNLFKDRTTIIISHRINSILHSDKVVVLNEGKVVGDDKYQSLRKNCNHYRELFEKQHIIEEKQCV